MQDNLLEISWSTILKVAIAFFAFYLIFLNKDILILSLFGLVISLLFEAPIRILEKKLPRGLAVAFLYVLIFSSITFLIYFPASNIVEEVRRFVQLFPFYFEQIAPPLRNLGIKMFNDIEDFINAMDGIVQLLTDNIFNVLFSIFGGITSTIFVVSMAIFLSLEGKIFETNLMLFFPEEDKTYVKSLWRRCQKRIGLWFLRTILGCLFVGITSYISFRILGANYPLSLAFLGGAFNFVPMIGSTLAGFLIFTTLALDSVPKAFFALLIYIIIQQIENNIVGPLLVKKFIGLSPTLILMSLAIGANLYGLLGAILTVPLIALCSEFAKGILKKKRKTALDA